MQDSDRRYWLLLGFLTLLYLLPLWVVRFLPFVDLPQHLSFVTILRNFNNPLTDYRQTFLLKLYPQHNVLHLLFCSALNSIVDVETANRLFLSLYVILFPLALHHLLRTLGGNRWLVVPGFLFVYNYNLFWGFVSSTFAIPLVLFILSLELRYLLEDRPKWWYLALIAGLFIVVFLGHSLFYLFATGLYLLALVARVWHVKGGSRRVIPVLLAQAPVLVAFIVPWQLAIFSGEGSDLVERVLSGFSLSNLFSRINTFFAAATTRGDDVSLFILRLYFVSALTAVIVYAARNGFRSLFAGRFRLITVATLAGFAAFLFFPAAIRQAWFLNERFVVFCFLLLTALLAVVVTATRFERRWVFNVMLVAVVFNAVNLGYRFIAADRGGRPAAKVMSKLEPDRNMFGLIYDTKTKPDLLGYDIFLHYANYYQVWKRGYPGFSFASVRYSPIQYRDSTDLMPPGYEWSPWEWLFNQGKDVYDYYLVYGRVLPQDQAYVNRWTLVDSSQGWAVYHRPDSLIKE